MILKKPQDFKFAAQLSSGKPIETALISVGPFSLELKGNGEFSLNAKSTLRPPKNEPLKFAINSKITKTGIFNFAGSMKGMWTDPFGISPFSIGNVGLSVSFDLKQLAATSGVPLPSALGVAGSMKLDTVAMTLNAQVDSTITKMGLLGKLNKFSLQSIVNSFAKPMKINIDVDKLPRLDAKDLEVRFAPTNIKIGEIEIPQGLTLRGILDILSKRVVCDFNIDTKSGITALGCMSKVDIGSSFHVSRSRNEPDNVKKYRAAKCKGLEDGPILDIQLNKDKQQIFISGRIKLDHIFDTDNFLIIAKDAFGFNFETSLFNDMGLVRVIGTAARNDLNKPDFILDMLFKQAFTAFIQNEINDALEEAEEDLINKFEKAHGAIKGAKGQIDAAQDKITAEKNKKVLEIQAKIDAAHEESRALKKQSKTKNAFKILQLETKIKAYQAEQLAIRGAVGAFSAYGKVVGGPATKAALTVAGGVVHATGKVAAFTVKGTNKVIQTLADTIAIEEAQFKGSLQEVVNGTLPHMEFKVILLGQRMNPKFDYDFKKPLESAKSVAKNLVKYVTDKLSI